MLKEMTGDVIEDTDIAVIIREGYRNVVPDTEMNHRLYEKYPKLKDNDDREYKEYKLYGSVGSIDGTQMDDGRLVITWYMSENPDE